MRLERLAIRGVFDAFPDLVEVPFRDIPAGVIAVTGDNGQGKTALLEVTPGTLYRSLPAREGDDPVLYALGRDSYLENEFTIDGVGTFRARLNLDGPKRASDALLEQLTPDGGRVPLNDGKRSTFDAAIKARFPSFDLFINSSFAAQGRGDEFTRRKPSQRKDLFVELLALQHYARMAETAGAAAALAHDARLRLTVVVEQLARATAPEVLDALEQTAADLQRQGSEAGLRRQGLRTRIATLEAQAATLGDQMAAYAAAQERVRVLEQGQADRIDELQASQATRAAVVEAFKRDVGGIVRRREETLRDIRNRIAGNKTILDKAAGIREAVTTIAELDAELVTAREELERARREHYKAAADLRVAERALADLRVAQKDLARTKQDAELLGGVPCGGQGLYAACRFLVNATEARGRIPLLERQLGGLADDEADRNRVVENLKAIDGRIAGLDQVFARIADARAPLEGLAKYDKPLLEAETRIAELETRAREVEAEATRQTAAAVEQLQAREREFDDQQRVIRDGLLLLEQQLATARQELEVVAGGHTLAGQVLAALEAARREWDDVTTTIATVDRGRQELERRREEIRDQRARLEDARGRLAGVEQELLEWHDLEKALGKGGLQELEIDAAGPTISATTNALLLEAYGPRFSVELVTQTAKVDGGEKSDFTVRVFDNAAAGAWRDIRMLSGGQKVIVQEALMNAIALYVNERSPMPIRTLWRDETGAALDPDHAVRYVQMLRAVRELGGFHHVLFVSHNRAASALADTQIHVEAGRAEIRWPPFSEAA